MPAVRIPSLALLIFLAVVSCAGPPPRPSLDEVTGTWKETIEEWGDSQRAHAETLDREKRDDYLGRHSGTMANLHHLNMLTILHTASEGDWHGLVRIDGECRSGAPVTIRLSTCPPGRRFAPYSSPDLAQPLPHPSGNNDYWILDLGRQELVGEGTIDARGEASVTVHPSGPAGAFRGFQATILRDGEKAGGAAVGFMTAHGRRLR